MADPRNIAHDKKVQEEKKHHGEEITPGAAVVPQPGKKAPLDKDGPPIEGHDPHHRSSPQYSADDSGKVITED